MAELLEIRRSLAAVVRGFDPTVVVASDATLVVREAVRIKNLATTLETLAAGRVAESGLWKQKGYRSPADWLATESKERAGDVIGVIETAQVLDACPATAAKARAGELSGPRTAGVGQSRECGSGGGGPVVGGGRARRAQEAGGSVPSDRTRWGRRARPPRTHRPQPASAALDRR